MRAVPHRGPQDAERYLRAWLTSAKRSKVPAFGQLAIRLERHFNEIVNAVVHGLSDSRAEGINGTIRGIQHHGYGHANPDSLIAMSHLCLNGISLLLPTESWESDWCP